MARAHGRVGRLVAQVAHMVHPGVGCGVDLDQVGFGTVVSTEAALASAAGLDSRARFAVESLGENPRRGGLARAPRAAEEVGMAYAALPDGTLQGARDHGLTHDIAKETRSVFSGQDEVAHGAADERIAGNQRGAF